MKPLIIGLSYDMKTTLLVFCYNKHLISFTFFGTYWNGGEKTLEILIALSPNFHFHTNHSVFMLNCSL